MQIVQALRDEFPEQVVAAADRLVEIDHESDDALVIAAAARMETNDLDGADEVLQRALEKPGPSGVVLTNVAKVQDRRGAKRDARATLRRALELDPNQDNGLLWWASSANEAGGESEYVAALEAIAVLPGAWRPQLWLARGKLKAGDRAGALALYDQALSRAGDAADALMMVTGDLGNAGALEDLVRLGAPRYKPDVHGPPAGMNIAQALKQLGRVDEARDVVRRMQAMGWAPLAATLAALDADIMAAAPPAQDGAVPEVGAVAFDRPIWTRFLWEPDWLWRESAADEPVITLPTFANEMVTASGMRKSDDLGRLTRALPLYLEEVLQVRFRVRARASLWVARNHGPAVAGRQPDRETLESAAPPSTSRRIIVAGSLVSAGVTLRIWEIGDPEQPAEVPVAVALNDPAAVVAAVERALLDALKTAGPADQKSPLPPFYRTAFATAFATALAPARARRSRRVRLVPGAALLSADRRERAGAGRLTLERARVLRELRRAGRRVAERAGVRADDGNLRDGRGGDVQVGDRRAVSENRARWVDEAAPGGIVGRLAPAIFKRLGEQARYEQLAAARARARRRALHGLAGTCEDGKLSAAIGRARTDRASSPLLGEFERAVLAVDLEGEVLDLGRARGVVVDLGADLDARQPHGVREAAVLRLCT